MPEFAILKVSADPINKNRFSDEEEYSMITALPLSSNSMKLSQTKERVFPLLID